MARAVLFFSTTFGGLMIVSVLLLHTSAPEILHSMPTFKSLRGPQRENVVRHDQPPRVRREAVEQAPKDAADTPSSMVELDRRIPPPPLPPHAPIPDAEAAIAETLGGNPSLVGIVALLERFIRHVHDRFVSLSAARATTEEVYDSFLDLAKKEILPFDRRYDRETLFPIRDDDSVFVSLASFRDHLLGATLQQVRALRCLLSAAMRRSPRPFL